MKDFFDRLFSGSGSCLGIAEAFACFTWRDAVDIFLLAALFFAVFRYVRDRRAGRLFWGVGILLGVYAASELLDFYTLRYVFGSFFGYGIIAAVVIFQPELRAMLERVGAFSFRRLKNIGTESGRRLALTQNTLDEIVLAVKHMSFSKTGALIAIERSIKIGEYAESGTVLNSEISARLLQTIFFNMTPLHDGAVIIRDGRIFAAGCNLPLTQNTEPIKDLGTRHRAAVGASEDSDAIIIVVSEQTGVISVAYKGELLRNFTSVSLRRKLAELLGMQRNNQQRDEEQQ
jgi:diadenylate cyclase